MIKRILKRGIACITSIAMVGLVPISHMNLKVVKADDSFEAGLEKDNAFVAGDYDYDYEVVTEGDYEGYYDPEYEGICITAYNGEESNVVIPETLGGREVVAIGDSAFLGCEDLEEIEIHNNIEKIEAYAFAFCNSLKKIVIPSSVVNIEYGVFYDCDNVIIYCEDGSVAHEYAIDNNIPYVLTKKGVTVTPKDKQVKVSWTAVSGASKYQVVSYVGGKYTVQVNNYIGTSYTVTGLTNGTKYGFLVRAYVNGAWTSYSTADLVYAIPTDVIKPVVTVSTGVKQVTVNWTAVLGASKYQVVSYVEGKYTVQVNNYIGTSYTVTGLTNGTRYGFLVRAYVNGVWTSYSATDLVFSTPKELDAYENVKEGYYEGYYDPDYEGICITAYNGEESNVVIPETIAGCEVVAIGDDAFEWNEDIINVTFSSGIKEIGWDAFASCYNLETVKLNENLLKIKTQAFHSANSLKNINLPDSLETIEWGAFAYTSLTSIDIPANVKSISGAAFMGCNQLYYIKVNINNKFYDSRNDCNAIINTESDVLIQGCGKTIIPADIKEIGDDAFSGLDNLKEIQLPEGITKIGNSSFCHTGLISISFPKTLIHIDNDAFYGCYELKQVIFFNGIEKIGEYAFKDCYDLSEIKLPESLKYIETGAFSSCWDLIKVEIPKSVTQIGEDVFYQSEDDVTIYCEDGSVAHQYAIDNEISYILTEAKETKPVVTVTAGDKQVKVSWKAVTGASKYQVVLYVGGKYTVQVNNYTGTSYTVTGLTNGTKYGFLVRAYVNGTWTSYSTADLVYATPAVSKKPVVTVTAGDKQVKVSWTAVTGASKYQVVSYVGGKYTVQVNNYTGTSYTVTGLTNGTKYGFLVRAYVNGSWTSYSTADLVYTTPAVSKKPVVTVTAGDKQVKVSWAAVTGASKYQVVSYVGGKYTVQVNNYTGTSYTVSNLTNGTKYGFLVRAYVNGAWTSYGAADLVYATPTAELDDYEEVQEGYYEGYYDPDYEGIHITKYNGKDSNVVIPETMGGCEVVAIGSGAFTSNQYIKSVTLSSRIECIGSNAFGSCRNLENVKCNEGLKIIYNWAFSECKNLKNIEFSNLNFLTD